MTNLNIIDPVIEMSTYKSNDSDFQLIASVYNQYGKVNNLFKKTRESKLNNDAPIFIDQANDFFDLSLFYNKKNDFQYDKYGDIIEINDHGGFSVVCLWGYNHQYPIAEIKNATYLKMLSVINKLDLDKFANEYFPNMSRVDAIRLLLQNAQVLTYSYKPHVVYWLKRIP